MTWQKNAWLPKFFEFWPEILQKKLPVISYDEINSIAKSSLTFGNIPVIGNAYLAVMMKVNFQMGAQKVFLK